MVDRIQGRFERNRLPDPVFYYGKIEGLTLLPPHGTWRSTQCVLHGGNGRALRINVVTGRFACMSPACGASGGVLDFAMQRHGLDFLGAARQLGAWVEGSAPGGRAIEQTFVHAIKQAAAPLVVALPRSTLSESGQKLWHGCQPIAGPALAYLLARGCAVPPADGDLRWHPDLGHPSGYRGPALVALGTDAITRKPLTLHRTWIRVDGSKAEIDSPRLLLAGHRKQGAVIRLWPDEALTHGLALAEGIETSLALAHAYQPVWSTLDAGNLAALPVLGGVEVLVIGADHDPAGLAAAAACAERWATAGVDVRVIAPEDERTDWCDQTRTVS